MPSVTFLALLNEGHKLEIYDMKRAITVAGFPHMDVDKQELIAADLVLPDDVLSDILEGEERDDINTIKEAFTPDGN